MPLPDLITAAVTRWRLLREELRKRRNGFRDVYSPGWLPAEKLRPGMCVWHPSPGVDGDDRHCFDVTGVCLGSDLMVTVHAVNGPPVVIAHDCPVELFTEEDHELIEFLLTAETFHLPPSEPA